MKLYVGETTVLKTNEIINVGSCVPMNAVFEANQAAPLEDLKCMKKNVYKELDR